MPRNPSDWELNIKRQIRRRYTEQNNSGGLHSDAKVKLKLYGYPQALIDKLPKELINRFSGCGCPITELHLLGHETIIDLGAGAGIDSFLLALSLDSGKVISLDLSPISLSTFGKHLETLPVYPVSGDIERIPLADEIADIVICNAALNLTIDKATAINEVFRLLKPGSIFFAADLVSDTPLPREVIENPLAHTTSLGGITTERNISRLLEKTGFKNITISGHQYEKFATRITIKAVKLTQSLG